MFLFFYFMLKLYIVITKENQTMNGNIEHEYPKGIWCKGIWCIDNTNPNMALKISGEKIIKVPLTKEILEEIKRQIEANKLFKFFQQVNINNEHIIGYLNLILDDYVNFLDTDNLNNLIIEMTKLEKVDHIDTTNILYITKLRTCLETNKTETFYETLEQFQNYNQKYFTNAFLSENSIKKN